MMMLATCAIDVKFHDWQSCEYIGVVTHPDPKTNGFVDICWCNEGKRLVAVPTGGKSLVISPYQSSLTNEREDRWNPLKEVIDISGVKAVNFSKTDTPHLALGTLAGEVLLYNCDTKVIFQKFYNLPASIKLIQYGAKDLFIAAGCTNGQIFLYGEGYCLTDAYYVPNSDTLSAMTVHRNTPFLLAGGSDNGIISIWDTSSGTTLLQAGAHKASVVDMAFSTNDDTFTTIGKDHKLNIYDMRTAERVHEKLYDTDLTALAYCPNGIDIAVGTDNGLIIYLDKRYLHTSNNSLKAHQFPIKKIAFESNTCCSYCPSKTSVDIDDLPTRFMNQIQVNEKMNSDAKLPTNNSDKCTVDTSKCCMGITDDVSLLHIIDDQNLNKLRDDIKLTTKTILDNLMEIMNNEFLKLRMNVSREFCCMEIRNKKKWQEFNAALLKIADMEEQESCSKEEAKSRATTPKACCSQSPN